MSDWDKAGIDEKSVKEKVKEFLDKKKGEELFSDKQVKQWAEDSIATSSKICAMIYGSDGSGKTGLVYDYLTDEDVKQNKTMWIIDLDGGGTAIRETYHKSKGKNLIVINPLVTEETPEGTQIDYLKTFAKIRSIVRYVRDNYKKENIKAIIFDGLSTALSYAEAQMRVEKAVDVDGGIQLRYWLLRNKLFLETLEQIRLIPITKFFIGHENFLASEDPNKKTSSVVSKTSAMMTHRIHCIRQNNPMNVEFVAVFDKSKTSVKAEGQRMNFCNVNKADRSFKWDTKQFFGLLEQ